MKNFEVAKPPPKIVPGGTLTIRRPGDPRSVHEPRQYVLKYEHVDEESLTFHSRTFLASVAAEYVNLAIRTTHPADIIWAHGTEELKDMYGKLYMISHHLSTVAPY